MMNAEWYVKPRYSEASGWLGETPRCFGVAQHDNQRIRRQFQFIMRSIILFICGFMLLSIGVARAATPDLQMIEPQGVQRGSEADLELRGARLADSQELFFFSPGVTVTS